MFQITEDDLATLERECAWVIDMHRCSRHRSSNVSARQIKRILSDVRWNYGPPEKIENVEQEGGAS